MWFRNLRDLLSMPAQLRRIEQKLDAIIANQLLVDPRLAAALAESNVKHAKLKAALDDQELRENQ